MKLTTILSLVLLSFLLQGGCQDGSAPIAEGIGGLKSGPTEPVVEFTCNESEVVNDINVSEQSGYDGNVIYSCDKNNIAYGFDLMEGLDEMWLDGLDITSYIDIQCPEYTLQFTITKNYVQGRNLYTGSHSEYGNVDCTEKYSTESRRIPTTIYDKESITELFTYKHATSNDDPLILDHSSFCPDIMYEEILPDALSFDKSVCHGHSVDNYKIEDGNYKYHNISIKKEF